MILPLFVTLVSAGSAYLCSRPEMAGQARTWLYACLAEVPLALLAVWALLRSGRLKQRLLPQRGDIFLGVVAALVIVIATWSARYLVMPHGSVHEAWLFRMYLQLGDPLVLEATWWLPLVLIVGSVLHELVWRAWIQEDLSERLGAGRGLAIMTGLYALTAVPTMFTLADPKAGTNPLFPLLAILAGLVWGYVTMLTGRATPAMVSHATFVYFSVMQFRPTL
jgi:membrane protease YdiL (CAAX protease family)